MLVDGIVGEMHINILLQREDQREEGIGEHWKGRQCNEWQSEGTA